MGAMMAAVGAMAAMGAEVESTANAAEAPAPQKQVEGRTLEADPTNVGEMLGQLKPGDTLELADGEYAPLTIGLQGEEGAPITIKPKGGNGNVRIAGDGPSCITILDSRWVSVEGITCPATRGSASIHVSQSTGCAVRECKSGAIMVQDSPKTTIEDNDISGGRSHGLRVICDSPAGR